MEGGKSVDTSMGFTPLEGLLMGTRGGDLDPGALLHLMDAEGLDAAETHRLINRRVRAAGHFRHQQRHARLLAAAARGDARAPLAIDVFCYRAQEVHRRLLRGVERRRRRRLHRRHRRTLRAVRARICESLDALGIRPRRREERAAAGVETDITAAGARTSRLGHPDARRASDRARNAGRRIYRVAA